MKWVTRARPKTDRVACPWPIRRFIDREQTLRITAPVFDGLCEYCRSAALLGRAAA